MRSAALSFLFFLPLAGLRFPDPDALGKSEQHRFELLLAHWDIETAEQPL